MPHPPVVDSTTFSELQDNAGADFVAGLVATFFEEAPKLLAELRDAHQQQSADRFRRAAHSIKSNALTFGAAALAAQALILEAGGLPAGSEAIDALEQEYGRVAAALKELCRG